MPDVSGPLPPFARILDFLPEGEQQRLLDWALSIHGKFRPATVSRLHSRIDQQRRVALTTAKLGPVDEMLRERFVAVLSELRTGTGTGGPPPTSLEIEIVAHGDGAYYRPHIDIPVGANRKKGPGEDSHEDRVLSAVYYFHAEPRAFSGGQLRLYRFGPIPSVEEPPPEPHIELEPVGNSLVAFPPWVPHEVRPVSCPSGKFRDYRFAVNCWYCRALEPASSNNS